MDSSKVTSSEGCKRAVTNNGEKKKAQKVVKRSGVEDETNDINKKAEDFIKNFRNQLRIQREESFKRFQAMIGRGT